MTRFCALIATISFLSMSACTSSHVITGTIREPVEPSMVRIYSHPPDRYEEIALLTATSRGSWAFTGQQKMNEVIDDLKKEAAKLGANGIVLAGLGTERGDSVAINTGQATATTYGNTTNAYGSGTTFIGGTWHKTGQALAIYVEMSED
jgi:hypothetical protein